MSRRISTRAFRDIVWNEGVEEAVINYFDVRDIRDDKVRGLAVQAKISILALMDHLGLPEKSDE